MNNDLEMPFPPPIRIVATRRRRRTVAARLRSGVLEVMVPASMPAAERRRYADMMLDRIARRRRRSARTDERLTERARGLNRRLYGGRLQWKSVGFYPMASQWASCLFVVGDIRVAERARHLPDWVLDYLLVHEMSHLEHSDHGPGFWEMVGRYPLAERARGYLMALDAVAAAAGPTA